MANFTETKLTREKWILYTRYARNGERNQTPTEKPYTYLLKQHAVGYIQPMLLQIFLHHLSKLRQRLSVGLYRLRKHSPQKLFLQPIRILQTGNANAEINQMITEDIEAPSLTFTALGGSIAIICWSVDSLFVSIIWPCVIPSLSIWHGISNHFEFFLVHFLHKNSPAYCTNTLENEKTN